MALILIVQGVKCEECPTGIGSGILGSVVIGPTVNTENAIISTFTITTP